MISLSYLGLSALGLAVAAYGTLIGAGGGFMLMPMLLLLYPHHSPSELGAVSLGCILLNTASGAAAYGRMQQIDYKSALLFSAATVPAAILGAMTTAYVSRQRFEGVFALFILCLALFLIMSPKALARATRKQNEADSGPARPGMMRRAKSVNGIIFEYEYNRTTAMAVFFALGFLVSFLGIGGGSLVVPALICLLDFPVFLAGGATQLIVAFVCLAGLITHIGIGSINSWGVNHIAAIGIGMLIGAQMGAFLSVRIKGVWILRGLAAALAAAGIRMVFAVL
ncbi:MAG: sulfite exporter TauE/SafE family protein [Syntrophobacteraceae bacterium]|nr:sulfite exporter TauE/SafE family protein [Syntrophobacteraceae bacterium]